MVSIVIINYNDKTRIKRAIESALNQTYTDIEVVVVDDGSDPETREIYTSYDNINLVQLERADISLRTPSRARNEGIKIAKGDYICFLDSDNYYEKDFVKEMMKDIKDVSYCNWEIVGKQNYQVDISSVWKKGKSILENYLMFTHLDHQCLLIRKVLLDVVGAYDVRLPRSQDCDLIVRLMLAGVDFNYVPKKLFVFEKHESDQMKTLASIHGKTLWTLKNNMDLSWLFGIVAKQPALYMVYLKAIYDFMDNDEWDTERNKSDFIAFYKECIKSLDSEKKEQ